MRTQQPFNLVAFAEQQNKNIGAAVTAAENLEQTTPDTRRPCKGGCGELVDDGWCRPCYREVKGPFSFGDDDE